MYMIEETTALTYVHDRGDNTPTHMYMIEETIPYVRAVVSSIM
jgi:hypothetical protein